MRYKFISYFFTGLLFFVSIRLCALELIVNDASGKAVVNAVVYSTNDLPVNSYTPRTMVMDQQQKQFVPHVLTVPKGTLVDFPNTDSVNHYVYSFSDPKTFQFKLFKGDLAAHQMVFDKVGLVTLGCNIHDFMLGYILVTPNQFAGVTDAQGRVNLSVPSGELHHLSVWHERSAETLKVDVTASNQPVVIQFKKPFKTERKMHETEGDY